MVLYRAMNMARKAVSGEATSPLLFNSLRGFERNSRRHCCDYPGQAKEKCRPKAQFALTANAPARGVDDMLGNRQPQPSAPGFPRPRLVDPVEALKDTRQVLIRDARAEVLHVELDHPFLPARPHPYAASSLAVFHRVLDQVSEDLAERIKISHDRFIGGLAHLECQLGIQYQPG